jgi:hypothetical protein
MGTLSDKENAKFDDRARVRVAPTPISPYVASDQVVVGAYTYFGFVNEDGAWYIQRQEISGSNIYWRYAKGDSGYAAAIADPANVTGGYDTFDVIF